MKLPNVKYTVKLGLLAMLPMISSCGKDHYTGIVVAKQTTARDANGKFLLGNLYLDIDGDSLADEKFSVSIDRLLPSDCNQQQTFYEYIQPGDKIEYTTRDLCTPEIFLERVNDKTYKEIERTSKLIRIRSEINQPYPER